MSEEKKLLCFEPKEFKGSRYRCLLATHQPRHKVIQFLQGLLKSFATVDEDDVFTPMGFNFPNETKLFRDTRFLSDGHSEQLIKWWLAEYSGNTNLPNWDIVSTCTIGGKKGLALIEAKAHPNELDPKDSCRAGVVNLARINAAIADINTNMGMGWHLSASSHYQLSNRLAWAWKIASLGVPVAIVYLGFLNDDVMPNPFTSHENWERCLHNYADSCVPSGVWNSGPIIVGDTPFIPVISSAEVKATVR